MKSIRTKFFLEKVLFGLNMVALGIMYQAVAGGWDTFLVLFICSSFIMAYFVFTFGLIDKIKFEPVDEMTRMHEDRAQAAVYNLLTGLLLVLGLAGMVSSGFQGYISSLHFSWWYIFYLVGILQIVEYVVFIRIERRGDPIE